VSSTIDITGPGSDSNLEFSSLSYHLPPSKRKAYSFPFEKRVGLQVNFSSASTLAYSSSTATISMNASMVSNPGTLSSPTEGRIAGGERLEVGGGKSLEVGG